MNRTFEFARLFSREWECLDDGGSGTWLYVRRTDVPDENRHRLFQFIEVTDMDDACGSDNEGHPKYVCELHEVHLDEIGAAVIQQARECVSLQFRDEDAPPMRDLMDAEACHSYGAKAPLGSWEGNGIDRLLRSARKAANELDARNGANILRAARLNMPVNRIGSTALEYMRGDLTTALTVARQPGVALVPQASILKWEPKP